jgi:hypothetical protein
MLEHPTDALIVTPTVPIAKADHDPVDLREQDAIGKLGASHDQLEDRRERLNAPPVATIRLLAGEGDRAHRLEVFSAAKPAEAHAGHCSRQVSSLISERQCHHHPSGVTHRAAVR